MMRSFAPFSSQNGSDRFSSASVVELGEMNPRPQSTSNGFRARIKARREAIAREAKERRSGDGQGGGIGNYFRILRYGTKWDILLMAIGTIAGLVTGVAFPLMTLILGNLVNEFGKFFEPGSNVTPEALRVGINGLCKQFLYIFFAKWIVGYISMICWRLSSTRISAAIRLEYITCIFKQDLTYFDTLALTPMPVLGDSKDQLSTDHTNPAVHKPGTPGSVAIAITTVSSIVQQGIGERTGGLFQSTSMLVAGFTIALMTNKNLAFVISSIIPVALVLYLLTIPFDVKIEKRIIMAQTKAADLAEEILGTIRTVKSFNAEKSQCAKYNTLLNRAKEQGLRKAPLVGVQHFTGIFIILCAFAICFRHGAKLYESGVIKDAGTIITVFFAAIFGIGGLAGLAVPIQAMSKACSASSIIFQVIDRKPLVDALSEEGHEPYTFPKGDIEMRNIRFAYPGGGDRGKSVVLGGLQRSPFADPELPPSNTLSEGDESNNYRDGGGLSLVFPAGKTTAIIGPSGAGKSTVLALLERWYEPQEGSILIGGVDIGEYNLRWWRGKIGLVMQEPFLFNTSIFKNIADGLQGTQWENLPEEQKRKMVHNACIDANAADFIDELPGKYDSIVGENGIKLSGGQKQRIAIARSIISRPSVLLLDEATSALDPVNERLVQKALDRVSKGRTTIMIAHRLSTIKDADKIVVLEEGNIVETGNRKDLLRQPDSAYSRLVRSQELSSVKSHEASETDPFADPESGYDTDDLERLGHENLHKEDLQNSLIRKKRWRKIGIFKLFALVFSEQRKFLWLTYLFGLVGAVGAGGITPIQSVLYASFMQTFLIIDDMEKFVAQTSFWALMFFCLALGGGFLTFLMGWMFTRSSHATGAHYRTEYFRNVVSQGITYFDKPENSPGDLTSRLSTYPMAIQDLIGAPTGTIISGTITLIASCSLALAICWKLSLVVIAVAVPLNFAAGYIKIKIEKRFVHDSLEVFEESSQFSTEAVGAFRTVSSLVLEKPIRSRYKNLLRKHVKRQSRRIAWSSIMYSAVDSLGILTTAFTWWYGGKLMSTGEISIFQFYLVYLIVLQGADASGYLVGVAHGIAFASISANRMFEVRNLDRKMPGKCMGPGETGGCEVEFKDVNFTYPTRSLRVFEGLNLRIEKGQFAAFVGASGCGKTTTISLLERFYDLREGRILIDGQDLASLDLEGYRDVVSLVSQEPTLYQGTIRENILFGVSGYVTDEEIVQVSRDAYLDEFVMTLPDGYNTICGSKGIGLSGGQRQRLAIARALIRKPRMLLLDEATASLDSESEKIVQRALEKAAEGRKMTMIAVAHRLSTIQNADVIFVFDGGRIVEKGDHQTLIQRKGIYFQMCEAQALDC